MNQVKDHKMNAQNTFSKSKMKAKLSPLAEKADRSIDSTTTTIGEGLSSVASSVTDGAQSMTSSVAAGVERTTDKIDRAGQYLQRADTQQLGGDIAHFAKTHPKASIAAGLGLGFLVARALKR